MDGLADYVLRGKIGEILPVIVSGALGDRIGNTCDTHGN
jgi:hypothetical protein